MYSRMYSRRGTMIYSSRWSGLRLSWLVVFRLKGLIRYIWSRGLKCRLAKWMGWLSRLSGRVMKSLLVSLI